MEPRGLMGGFYRISEWIMRFSVINLLWIVCSIPFFFFLLTLFVGTGEQLTEEQILGNMYMTLILMAVVAPFTLFPATAAMFTVARKWVMGEVDVPLFKTFFRGYKENYKQSMLGGILYTLLFAIMVVDFIVYREQLNILSYIFIAFLILLGVSMFNFFSMLAHYHMKTFQLLKNALLITIGKPFRSLSTAIMAGVVAYFSTQFTFLIPFFMGSIIAYLSFWNFNIIYLKLQEQAEKMKQSEEEEAEEAAEMDREDLVKDDSKDSSK
ncbi:YesL family protein [Paenibacillus chungangensis]|uniref:YesL family protein n=1 Tax=Paenibacillus chungangensis TaxID=696535 RepID=A0ABW3HM37_9BACL